MNPRTVVVLNGATAMPWLERVPAVLHAYYPGEEGGAALARILCGDVSLSGRLPVTLPRRLEDVPGMAFYPGDAERVVFDEGLAVGYRHFVSQAKVSPLFPFGFGLSYTRFSYSPLVFSADVLTEDGVLVVAVEITNTGERAGAEVVQLYLGAQSPSVWRPARELKAFEKVWLRAGERRRVEFPIRACDLAFYDVGRKSWFAKAGTYVVQVGPHCDEGERGEFVFEG